MLFIKTLVACLISNNMKKNIDGILVVEGKEDMAFISSYYNGIFVTTNGCEIPAKEIDFLKLTSKKSKILVLTDPDSAGDTIRKRINIEIPSSINLYIEPISRAGRRKHGVAESTKEQIDNILKEYTTEKDIFNEHYSTSDLYKIGLNNKEKRELVCDAFHLGVCNNKNLLLRINYLGIKMSQIEQILIQNYENQ